MKQIFDIKNYSNTKIIVGIYLITFIALVILGVGSNQIGAILGAYVQMSLLTIMWMIIPAIPLAIYTRLTQKTFFLSKRLIKVAFVFGLFMAFSYVLGSGSILGSDAITFNFGHILATICLAIYFFRGGKNKIIGLEKKTDFRVNFKRVFIIGGVFVIAFLAFIYYISNEDESTSQSPTKSNYSCQRKEPYKLEPEFERARSLRNQRSEQWGDKMDYSWFNCINVVYKDLPEEEGLFYFDKNSSIQNLTIYVDTGYKSSDDLLTSVLLEHEFAHVGQFINQITTGKETPCFESEASAFYRQLYYTVKLNKEEQNSINQKVEQLVKGNYDNESMFSAVSIIKELKGIAYSAMDYCDTKFNLTNNRDEWQNCWHTQTYNILLNFVKSDPYYQKQCN